MKVGGKSASGFTILESLIVLAVTGALFVSIITLISGKQNKVAFQSGINSLQQQIQQIVNESTSGYFPDNAGFKCSSAGENPPVIDTSGSSAQGTNAGCIFLGKVIQFSQGLTLGGDFQYVVWPIVANQNIGAVNTQQIGGAGANVFPAAIDKIAVTKTIPYGLKPYSMSYNGVKTAGVGFISGNNQGEIASSGADGLSSGSQTMSLYAISGTQVDGGAPTTKAQMLASLTSTHAVSNYVNSDSVRMCFTSSTTDQSGLITVGNTNTSGAGGANRALTVTLQIFGNATCS